MPSILNIAVIGAGTMAQSIHLPLLKRRWDRFAVTALVDHSPRRRRESAEVWGIGEEQRFETVGDLIAGVRAKTVKVDAAVLATDGLHVDDLLALMKRGIPTLVEPPLGYSAAEVERITAFERVMGRRLVMMAYPQQYDEVVSEVAGEVRARDVRMIDHEILMPAAAPLFGHSHVTAAAYDLPAEARAERRQGLQDAVIAGSGEAATQRDRDLYVKGLLTGIAHQLAVTERIYGPITRIEAVRHWPKGVIPGSIELLGELEGGEPVRLVWHYLPFAPQYSERYEVLSARKRIDLELAPPSFLDARSSMAVREKSHGQILTTSHSSALGAAEAMWEAFHAFVDKGEAPLSGAAEAAAQVALLREVLAAIVGADGRSLDPEPADDAEGETEGESETSTEGVPAADPALSPAAAQADAAEASAPSAPVRDAAGTTASSADEPVGTPSEPNALADLDPLEIDPSLAVAASDAWSFEVQGDSTVTPLTPEELAEDDLPAPPPAPAEPAGGSTRAERED